MQLATVTLISKQKHFRKSPQIFLAGILDYFRETSQILNGAAAGKLTCGRLFEVSKILQKLLHKTLQKHDMDKKLVVTLRNWFQRLRRVQGMMFLFFSHV